jgi:hypothetical protein
MQDAGTVLEVLRDRGRKGPGPVANAAQSLESPVH